jgi:hypothetical protein
MPRISKVAEEKVRAPDWDEGDYITLRTAPVGFDLERIAGASQVIDATDGTAQNVVRIVVTPHEENQAKLEAAVVGGTFRDDDGRVLPYSPELLRSLSPEDRRFVLGEINRLWAPWLKRGQGQAATPEAQRKEDFRNGEDAAAGPGGEAAGGESAAGAA